jgi:hypothetical protein
MSLVVAVNLGVHPYQTGEQRGSRTGMTKDKKFIQGEERLRLDNLFCGDGQDIPVGLRRYIPA